MKKLSSLFLILSSLFLIACQQEPQLPTTNLVYYKLYENSPNFTNLLNEYQKANPNINIIFKNFTDPEVYYDTIVNEIAEGRGPDILSVHNTWVAPNYAKLSPAPSNLVSVEDYQNIFVGQAYQDNVLSINQTEQVYGIPLQMDNLALYYNQNHFEQTLPQDGRPGQTWTEIQNQSRSLTNTSSQRSGVALGDGSSILRSMDTFYNLALQTNSNFYDRSLTESEMSQSQEIQDTLDFITSFSDPENDNYTWNPNLSYNEKELASFIQGDTSMIFGYTYLYQELQSLINTYQRQGVETIDISDIKISTSPQVDTEQPTVFANYYTETVSRNSQNPEAAWSLIGYLSSRNSLESYYDNNFKLSPRRDMVESQSQNRIFNPFVQQIGITQSLPIIDQEKQKNIIKEMIDNYPTNGVQSIQNADRKINTLIQGRALRPN